MTMENAPATIIIDENRLHQHSEFGRYDDLHALLDTINGDGDMSASGWRSTAMAMVHEADGRRWQTIPIDVDGE